MENENIKILDSAAKKCENEKDKELLEEVHDVLWHFLKS